MSKLNNETNNKRNNVELTEETNMKKEIKKIRSIAIYTAIFTASLIISFFATKILIQNKKADTEAEVSKVTEVEDIETIDPSEEHEHIWESVGHTETIDGKITYIEDYERCSICGEKR